MAMSRQLDNLLQQQSEVDLKFPALLPDDFIPDVNIRLSMYKRIASAKTLAELDDLQVELIDRFGLLPDASKNLFALQTVKLKATSLASKKVK